MQNIESMTIKQLYRGILRSMKAYPSTNRGLMKEAIVLDVADWKLLTDELEILKAEKRMRMLYGHVQMWEIKMEEVLRPND